MSLRPDAPWIASAALLLALPAGAAELSGRRLGTLPSAVRESLTALAEAVEVGDRAALAALLRPESRPSAAPLIESLVPGPTVPPTALRLRVVGWSPQASGGVRGRAILEARVAPPPAASQEPPAAGLRPERGLRALGLGFRASEDGLLDIEEAAPAPVVAARIELRVEPEAKRLSGLSELELRPELPQLEAILLSLPPGTDRVEPRGLGPGAARWLQPALEGGGGELVLELAEGDGPLRVQVAHEGAVTDEMMAGPETLYLPHGGLIAPWAGGAFHGWEIVLDVPDSLEAVSIGRAERLEAPEGRRKVRYATDRPIDYPGLAVAPFDVHRDGPLELWRVAQVGGEPAGLLAELSELVAFHEERVAPLPYGAFRLVEVDMDFAGAVSYASVIFMKTSVMATARRRFAILSHEVAHQWWGNAVQGDANTRWISEGMANALMDLFTLHREGAEAFQDLLDEHREITLSALGPAARPLADVSGRPADFYHRGALFVHALREELGDELFWSVLRAWYAEHAGPAVSTAALRASAERVAGRSLARVFEPWLGTTALPVVGLDWAVEGTTARLHLRQDEPAFALSLPVEALLPGGRSEWRILRVDGRSLETELTWELDERPLALRLDPEQRTPRVRDGEMGTYLLGEGQACLARGETRRGLALLARHEAEHGMLPEEAEVLRGSALALTGETGAAEENLSPVLGAATTSEAAKLRLELAEQLLLRGAAAQALPILEELGTLVDDGAAVPLRLGRAELMLGRPQRARAAWRIAHERRPANLAARLGLGLPAPPEEDEAWQTLVEREDRRLDGNRLDAMHLLAASRGRWGLALAGSRAVWTGRGADLLAVPGFSPSGLAAAVVVDPAAEAPLVAALETGPRRSRLSVLSLDELGHGRVVAVHGRLPGDALGLLAEAGAVHLAFSERDGGRRWFRFRPPLDGPGTEGPDDRDGLVTLKAERDERLEPGELTPEHAPAAMLRGGRLAWLDPEGALLSSEGPLWEEMEAAGRFWRVRDLRSAGDGAALLLGGDRSRSPFDEDALPAARLVVAGPERLEERELPPEARQAVEEPDGSLLVLCGTQDPRSVEAWVLRSKKSAR